MCNIAATFFFYIRIPPLNCTVQAGFCGRSSVLNSYMQSFCTDTDAIFMLIDSFNCSQGNKIREVTEAIRRAVT